MDGSICSLGMPVGFPLSSNLTIVLKQLAAGVTHLCNLGVHQLLLAFPHNEAFGPEHGISEFESDSRQ